MMESMPELKRFKTNFSRGDILRTLSRRPIYNLFELIRGITKNLSLPDLSHIPYDESDPPLSAINPTLVKSISTLSDLVDWVIHFIERCPLDKYKSYRATEVFIKALPAIIKETSFVGVRIQAKLFELFSSLAITTSQRKEIMTMLAPIRISTNDPKFINMMLKYVPDAFDNVTLLDFDLDYVSDE